MRSGAVHIGLGGSAEDDKLIQAGKAAVSRMAARSYSLSWSSSGEPVLEVDWISGGPKSYRISKTIFGEKILSDTGSEFPVEWIPNELKIPWSPEGFQLPSSSKWPDGFGSGPSAFQPETKKSFLDTGGSGSSSSGSGSPGGKKGLLTWAPRGWPSNVSDYLKWAFILGAIGVGVVVLDFVTKD